MTATPKPDPGVSFTREEGVVHIGGIDALVRLTLDQVRADERRGLKTGMFVSGYRGSPVGMLDAALHQAAEAAARAQHPGSSTASTRTSPPPRCGARRCCTPSATRSSTASPACGTARRRASTAAAMRSSTPTTPASTRTAACSPSSATTRAASRSSLCSQSEPMLFHVGMPSLYPGNVQEILDLGLHGYLMSRPVGAVGRPEDRHQRRRRLGYAPTSRRSG